MKRHPTNGLFLIVAGTTWLLASGTALAQGGPGRPGSRGRGLDQCKDDIAKLCASVGPGGGKLLKCLHDHKAELSEPCQAALAPGGKGGRKGPGAPVEWGPMPGMRKSCSAEIGKLCKDTVPGHGRIAVCLNEHKSELSPGCKTSVDQVTTQMSSRMEMHDACAPDVQKLCGDVPPGSGQVAFCLGEHAAELSPACKQQVAKMKAGWAKRDFGGRGKPAPAPAPVPPPPPAPK